MMKKLAKIRAFYIACALLTLSGCAQLNVTDNYWTKPGQMRSGGAAVSLLMYLDYTRNLSAADYAHELDHVRELAADGKSVYRSLQYALALSLPGGDSRKAQQLIESLSKDNKITDPELNVLSSLVSADLAERRRLEIDLKRAENEAKKTDVESKRADTESKRAEAEVKRADIEMKRADELQKKLDAVKNIEKKLIDGKKTRTDK
jgi:hypothetical protein